MRVTKLQVFKVLVVLAVVATMSACSMFRSKKETIDTMPVEKLYSTAHDSLVHSDYAAATKAYQRLIARFPSGDFNEQAQLDLAYSQYKDNQPDDAYSTVNRFIKTYPTHKHVDYAYYLRGLINFDRTGGFIERVFQRTESQARRDQGYNLQAFDDFSELTRRFPDSAYSADARQRMIYLRNVLAQFEVNVAEFYLRRKAYIASADRAQYVIEHYQQAPQTGDALAILTRSYIGLERPQLAEQTRKVLALNYPNHPYLTDEKWPHAPSTLRKMVPFSGHH
ncbi:outer membrane protein assembly factor BamD [Dyella sp. SG562]|uniref:outer membrane protein assembly factor BamD n=1 Tax=Dyella TaxID=231454 RepID=UPI0014246F9D|nr:MULTISPECIES: outer membrane protein assembly factor BamD [unclassified Dyella]MBT2115554.1 outer membrane protein assembly factor BamD [Dyella sp. LX-1]MBT2139369.1 outer membrane protein assembly factor BamD [Dyella sp. LX-66]NII71805.1 outer membrane protein assembly factor BamD [Dyella sp. SG562]NKJ21437.1 outer membrane protein assembly factor BamD [Dyella sp. SG609]